MLKPGVEVAEGRIWQRLIQPGEATLSPEAAKAWLAVRFGTEDRSRMEALAQRNQEGKLKAKEKRELAEYIRVGDVLGLIHSKARQSLKKANLRA